MEAHLLSIKVQLDTLTTKAKTERRLKLIKRVIQNVYRSSVAFEKMTYDQKRALAKYSSAGKDAKGQRLGIYVKKTQDPDRPWEFKVKGIFDDRFGKLPMTGWEREDLLGLYLEGETKFAYY